MRAIPTSIVLFIAGLTIGSAVTTMAWKPMLDRAHAIAARANNTTEEALKAARAWKENSNKFEHLAVEFKELCRNDAPRHRTPD